MNSISSRLPEPTRVLHVIIPEAILWHVRAMASQSRMAVKHYVARILMDAGPITPAGDHKSQAAHVAGPPETPIGNVNVPTRHMASPDTEKGPKT